MPRGVAAGLLVAHDSIRRRRSLAGSFIRSRAATRPRTMVNPRTAIGLSRVPMSDPAAPLTSTGVASGLNGAESVSRGARAVPKCLSNDALSALVGPSVAAGFAAGLDHARRDAAGERFLGVVSGQVLVRVLVRRRRAGRRIRCAGHVPGRAAGLPAVLAGRSPPSP